MSFILDALKKLESEKKKKEVDISVMEQVISDDQRKSSASMQDKALSKFGQKVTDLSESLGRHIRGMGNSIFNKKIKKIFKLNNLLLPGGLLCISILFISIIIFKNR